MLQYLEPFTEGNNNDYYYNLIHCQSDLQCYDDRYFEYNGNARKVCENIDPLQPNYIERGLLQNMNFARLFQSEWRDRYNKTMGTECASIIPIHPLWEHKGATEVAHFLSVSNRDCSINPPTHWTCEDYCYKNANDPLKPTIFKPFDACNVQSRKDWFQWNALKNGSYTEIFNSRQIQYQAEAECGTYWPCVDPGHCGLYYKQSRFLIGVGIALPRDYNRKPISYLKGTRTYDVKDISPNGQMEYWKKFDQQLYRIPSASHYDKCILDRNCITNVTEWKSIIFQMTYAHHTIEYVSGSATLHLQGNAYNMDMLHTHKSSLGATWAIFETIITPYPKSCESYYFTIQSFDGNTYRLPQDPQLEYATTGNGCDVNHYTNGEENCPGEDPTQEGTRYNAAGTTPTTPQTTPPPTTNPPQTTPPPTTTPPQTTPPPTTTPPQTTPPPTPSTPNTPPPTTPSLTPQPTNIPNSEFRGIATPLFNLCMDIRSTNIAGNPLVYIRTCTGNDNQMWYMDESGLIRTKLNTNKCLTMNPNPAVHALRLTDCSMNNDNQIWIWQNGRIQMEYERDQCIFWDNNPGRQLRLHTCTNGDIRYYWAWK